MNPYVDAIEIATEDWRNSLFNCEEEFLDIIREAIKDGDELDVALNEFMNSYVDMDSLEQAIYSNLEAILTDEYLDINVEVSWK